MRQDYDSSAVRNSLPDDTSLLVFVLCELKRGKLPTAVFVQPEHGIAS